MHALFLATFLAVAAAVIVRQGWWPAIRRHPLQAILIAAGVFAATLSGGTKPGTNEPPPIVPAPTNIVLRLYWHAPDGRLYPIDALLKEIAQ